MAVNLIHNKWRITRRIGGGSFGEIYMGVGPNNEKVAVKFEKEGTRCPQLRHEYKVYRELVNCHGFCAVYYFGQQDNHNVMVMDLMGLSLEDLFNKCARKFSLKTVLQIADQMLERADTLHSRHLIHRDIKPANFVIGLGDQAANVYCVDFGLSKRYRHPKTLQHIPHRDGRSLTGTPRYASINNHLGIEQSRRDDLESIAYILIYFLKGLLPWQGLKAKNASKKYMLILNKKQSVSIAQLCQGCPNQFAEFLAYSRSLKFDAKPDIPYLRKIFRDLYNAQGCANSGKMWDWDGLDLEAGGSVQGSAGGGAGIVIGPPAVLQGGMGHLRPNTSAAVAPPNEHGSGLLGTGMGLLGGLFNSSRGSRGELGDDDDDYGGALKKMAGDVRPNTTQHATGNKPAGQQTQWGFTRPTQSARIGVLPPGILKESSGVRPMSSQDQGGQGLAGAGDYDGGTGGSNRRPHTANLTRSQDGSTAPGEESDAHVVAGARAMMRYRDGGRSSLDGAPPIGSQQTQPPQQHTGTTTGQPILPQAVGGGAGLKTWVGSSQNGIASSSGNKYPSVGAVGRDSGYNVGVSNRANAPTKPAALSSSGAAVVNSSAMPPAGVSSGWVVSDRPKSAAGTALGPTGAPMTSGNGNGAAMVRVNSNSTGGNSLSYGTIKNRFLSSTGGAGGGNAASGKPEYGAAIGSGGSAGGGKVSGKMYGR